MNGGDVYLLVEGPQDVTFVSRVLVELGMRSVEQPEQIPVRWQPFVDWPKLNRDRAQRDVGRENVPFWKIFKPALLLHEFGSVVLESVNGNRTRFARTLKGTNQSIDGGLAGLAAVGLLPDGDSDPEASFQSARDALRTVSLPVPGQHGELVQGKPRTGIFVFPDGVSPGGLEELLIDCGQDVYPALVSGAKRFVRDIQNDESVRTLEDFKELRTPQGPSKAVVTSAAGVLKPGSTMQVSIRLDRWVGPSTLNLPRMAALRRFLKTLCGLS